MVEGARAGGACWPSNTGSMTWLDIVLIRNPVEYNYKVIENRRGLQRAQDR